MEKKREIGLDLIKFIARCFVVIAHRVIGVKGIVNQILVFLPALSMPLFIMVNGYLMFQKKKITYTYI